MLNIQKHEGKQTLDQTGVNILIYGNPGAGKTTLSASFPKPLYIDTERGTKFIDTKMDVASVTTWEEVKEVMSVMQTGQYQTVVFDVVDEIHSIYTDFVKRQKPSLFNSAGAPTIQGWGVLKEGWRKFSKMMCFESSFNTVFVAHQKVTQDDDGKIIRISPKLMGSAASELVGFVDFSGFKVDETQIDFRKTAVLQDTKDRHNTLCDLDSPIFNPTYEMLCGLVKGTFPPLAAILPAKFTSLEHAYESCAAAGFDKKAVDDILAKITAPKKAVELRKIIFQKIVQGA